MATNNPDTIPETTYRSSELINREDELTAIQEMLYRLTTPGRLLPKPILEFNGIGGIGKTILLKRFWQESKASKGLHCAFVDFHEFIKELPINLNMLIIEIVRQIGIKNDWSALIETSMGDMTLKQDLTLNFIEYLRVILQTPQQETPLALIFDSVDEVDKTTRDWLIALVERTIEAGKIFFAIASKISVGFDKIPNLEKKIYSFRLRELSKEFTLRQIQRFSHFDRAEDLENLAHAVFRVTHGHPLANEVVVSEAREKKYQPQIINSRQYEFAQIINQQVVKEKIFHGYDEAEINWFRQMLTPLSIPRMFNLVSMGKLIGQFSPQYAFRSSWHYSNYIRELQAQTSFIRYSREKSAYVVDPILRRVFSLTLKNENPKKFDAIHEFLIAMYAELTENARDINKTKFFIEKIYHQLSLEKPLASLLPQFEEFSQLIGQDMFEEERRDARQQFIEEFNSDPDLSEVFDTSAKHTIQEMYG